MWTTKNREIGKVLPRFYFEKPWDPVHIMASFSIYYLNPILGPKKVCFGPKTDHICLAKNWDFSPITWELQFQLVCNFIPRWQLIGRNCVQSFITVTSFCHNLWRHKYFWISIPPHSECNFVCKGEEALQIWCGPEEE